MPENNRLVRQIEALDQVLYSLPFLLTSDDEGFHTTYEPEINEAFVLILRAKLILVDANQKTS